MTRHAASLVLGYHGCDETIGRQVVSESIALEQSDKDYDWLGPGVYFWESDPLRALEWAKAKGIGDSIASPFVIGAVIDLGHCLDLLVREDIELLAVAYASFASVRKASGLPIPENRDPKALGTGDRAMREFG